MNSKYVGRLLLDSFEGDTDWRKQEAVEKETSV